MLVVDYQTVQATQKQDRICLQNQLCQLSAALQEVREQKHLLFEEGQILSQQQRAIYAEESILLQEVVAICAQLSCLREHK